MSGKTKSPRGSNFTPPNIRRFYIFDPVSNMFLDWQGKLAKFSGAKDYMSMAAALAAAHTHADCFIFELNSTVN